MLLIDQARGPDGSDQLPGTGVWQTHATQQLIRVIHWSIRSESRANGAREWTEWFAGLTITIEDNGETFRDLPGSRPGRPTWSAEKSA